MFASVLDDEVCGFKPRARPAATAARMILAESGVDPAGRIPIVSI
jgi:hypothetical protein